MAVAARLRARERESCPSWDREPLTLKTSESQGRRHRECDAGGQGRRTQRADGFAEPTCQDVGVKVAVTGVPAMATWRL